VCVCGCVYVYCVCCVCCVCCGVDVCGACVCGVYVCGVDVCGACVCGVYVCGVFVCVAEDKDDIAEAGEEEGMEGLNIRMNEGKNTTQRDKYNRRSTRDMKLKWCTCTYTHTHTRTHIYT